MFDIKKVTIKYQLFIAAKQFGLPIKHREKNPKVEHISAEDIDNQAINEAVYMKRAFSSETMGFGKKLRKSRGEQHRAGGQGQWEKGLPKMRQGDINNINYNDIY